MALRIRLITSLLNDKSTDLIVEINHLQGISEV
jgi:hypothetical protein